MKSGMGKLNIRDLANGLIIAIFAAVFTQLAAALNAPGFDFATFDWAETAKIAVAAAVAYLTKNFFTDSHGNFAGKKIKA